MKDLRMVEVQSSELEMTELEEMTCLLTDMERAALIGAAITAANLVVWWILTS